MERYNRRLHSLFPGPHPSLLIFVDVLFKESKDLVSKREKALRMIYTGCQERTEMEWPRVPDGFDGWEPLRNNKKTVK